MDTRDEQVHVTKEEARSGETPHVVRYVLAISLALVILALGAVWLFGTAKAPDNTGADADTARAVREAADKGSQQ